MALRWSGSLSAAEGPPLEIVHAGQRLIADFLFDLGASADDLSTPKESHSPEPKSKASGSFLWPITNVTFPA